MCLCALAKEQMKWTLKNRSDNIYLSKETELITISSQSSSSLFSFVRSTFAVVLPARRFPL